MTYYPMPITYPDCEKLIYALKRCRWLDWFKKGRAQDWDSDPQVIIRQSVGPNIFRAFRHLPVRPSVLFRKWAYQSFSKQFLSDFRKLDSSSRCRKWVHSVRDSLQQRWKATMGEAIAFGPSLKLVNLIAKRLCLFKEISFPEFERVVWFLEVPLDSYTIQAVASCLSTFPDAAAIGRVPKAATMGFIKNQRLYEAFQDGIQLLAAKADVPPIALDCLAWDVSHEDYG